MDTRARRAWIILVAIMVLTAVAAVVGGGLGVRMDGTPRQIVGGLFLCGAWILAVRFVLLDTWARWFWLAWFLLVALLPLLAGRPGAAGGIALSALGLAVHNYRAWRLLGDRRRAVGFGLGCLALVLLALASGFAEVEEAAGATEVLGNLGRWSLGSLVAFWLFSLFHLAIRMRLHFLRLRPKLAISAVLIGFVPLALAAVLALMVLYAGLGGARAARARHILDSWRATTAAGGDLAPALFDTTFAWPVGQEGPAGAVTVPAPDWLPDLAERLAARVATPADSVAAALVDTTAWFVAGEGLWLMRWEGLGGPATRVRGWAVGDRTLGELSRILRTGVKLQALESGDEDGNIVLGRASEGLRRAFPGRQVSYRDVSDDHGFWDPIRYFGGTLQEIFWLQPGSLTTETLFVNLKVGWEDLRAEFLEGEDNLNVVVVIALATVATLFLVIEIFALFFGVRITEGIVAAVRILQRGTRTVAAGDLDTTIRMPNEDEFGDLAGSFNQMTRAVKQGRDDALARERLTRELETARTIQERLLPDVAPLLAGFEVAGASIPSREIGGDYFDFIIDGSERLGVAIGDVSGKGMPAALLMSNLQASLHGQVIHPSSVAEIVGRVNDLLVRSTDPHMFATFFYGVLDPAAATFTTTNAGHNAPMVLRSDGTVETLNLGGLVLGMLPDRVYQQETITLDPGEIVLLYTDGITEAVAADVEEEDPGAMFGDEALENVLRSHAHLPAAGIKDAVLAAVAAHTAGAEQSDDITLVVVRRQG